LHLKFDKHWAALRASYDNTLKSVFEQVRAKKIAPLFFARAHLGPLSLFVSKDHLLHLIDVLAGKIEEPSVSVLQQTLGGSTACGLIFEGLAVRMNYQLFLESIKKQLKELENLNFSPPDVANFYAVMQIETNKLFENGFQRFEKLKTPLTFLNELVLWPSVGDIGVHFE
jgi:hypothetical protein